MPQWLRLRAADPNYHDPYWRFLLDFYDVRVSPEDFPFLLDGDQFETGHLWFVVLLLAYSLMLAAASAWAPPEWIGRARETPAVLGRIAFGLAGWCWLVAILGLLDRPRRVPPEPVAAAAPGRLSAVYRYLGTAALPLYILHQPIVVAVAYLVVGWSAPMPVKYVVIVVVSFVVMFAVYDSWSGARPSPAFCWECVTRRGRDRSTDTGPVPAM